MLLSGERPDHIDELLERLRLLSAKLFADLPAGQRNLCSKTDNLYASASPEHLFIVRSGSLAAFCENRLNLYFEPGDLIGLTQCYQLPSFNILIEESAEVEQYEADQLLRYVTETKERQAIWTSYLISLVSLFQDLFGRSQDISRQPSSGFLSFAPGQVIISQGDDARHVFTILSGEADVFVDGTQVGEILQDEIFGAMAVFTGKKRSATVQARTSCNVIAVPKEEFITLVKSHPQTTMILIENMAHHISTLNSQLTHKSAAESE